MDNITDTILKDNYTLLDITRRLKILKIFLSEKIYASNSDLSASYSKEDKAWLDSLGADFYKQFTKENYYQIFSELEKFIKKINVLVIYTSFELPEEEKIKLGLWLRQEFNKNFVYEPRINPSLIAGCALVWKGVYKDYSVKTTIDQKREEILSSFKAYFK